jgi:APA family basic amino acid/polyamine antiporter
MASAPAVAISVSHPRGRLLRVFGLVFGLAVIIGNTIGAGILRTPGEVAGRLPSAALFFGVWVGGGLYALLGAANLAELGAMLPRSGGQYVFARHAFGPYPGFVIGWSDWLSVCATVAAISIVIGEAVGVLVPVLAPHASAVAVVTVIAFTVLIWRGARESGRTQTLTSLLKAIAFLALIGACFLLPHTTTAAVSPARVPSGASLFVALVLAIQAVIYTYDGWNGVIYFSEEVHDPGRDIPRSMVGGVLSVCAIYLLLNLALVFVLSLPRMAGEPFVAAAAARALFGARGYPIVSALTVLSLLSAVNANLLLASRVPVAMSRDALFPAAASDVNARGTPTFALATSAAVAVLFIITGVFASVLAVAAFYFVVNYVVSFSALFVLRRREPDAPRPYRAWGYPWTTGLVLLGSVAFLAGAIAGDTRRSLYALGLLALSYPVFLVVRRVTTRNPERTA